MVYQKYKVANDAIGNLDAGISASTTSIVLESGDGDLFPTSGNAILKFVQYNTTSDPTSGVAKSENVLMTARTGDTLTVTRGYGGDTPTTFGAGDYVYLTNNSDVIEDIQDEVTRLETAKLNQDGELRTGNGAWKVIYNNADGDEQELSLGAANTYMRSTGANSAPEFGTPPLDINGQTLDNGVLEEADEIAFYDNSEGTENKRNAKATTSRAGLMEIATDSEVETRTDTERAITPSGMSAGMKSMIQARSGLSNGVNYEATANGFVYGWARRPSLNNWSEVLVYSDATSTPTTLQTAAGGNSEEWTGFCCPVVKGNYYRVDITTTGSGSAAAYFTALN